MKQHVFVAFSLPLFFVPTFANAITWQVSINNNQRLSGWDIRSTEDIDLGLTLLALVSTCLHSSSRHAGQRRWSSAGPRQSLCGGCCGRAHRRMPPPPAAGLAGQAVRLADHAAGSASRAMRLTSPALRLAGQALRLAGQTLRLAGRLPCPHCIQWCKGEKVGVQTLR